MRPIYIAFEGIEGVGKSTQAARFAASIDAHLTRENGGTPLGQRVREITHDPFVTMEPRTEALLFAADRAQHLAEVIEPTLLSGRHVVSDRSLYSSIAYQGGGRGLGMPAVFSLNEWACSRFPEVVFYLALDWDVARQRISQRNADRIEQEGQEFFDRVTDTFETMMNSHQGFYGGSWWLRIDASGTPDEVAERIADAWKLYLTVRYGGTVLDAAPTPRVTTIESRVLDSGDYDDAVDVLVWLQEVCGIQARMVGSDDYPQLAPDDPKMPMIGFVVDGQDGTISAGDRIDRLSDGTIMIVEGWARQG